MKNKERKTSKNTLKKLTSSMLAITLMSTMCMGAVGPAMADPVLAAEDETETVVVYAEPESGDKSVTVGNVTTTEGPGVAVTADGGATAELTTENISSVEEGVIAQALDSTVDVKVNGTIDSTDSDGIAATSYGEIGSTKVQAEGDITAGYAGIFADAYDGGTTTVTANGNVNSKKVGIYIGDEEDETDNFSKVDITVNGNVAGVSSEGIYMNEYVKGGDISIKVGGDVTSGGDDAVSIESYHGTKTKLDIAGNVVGQDYGVLLDVDEGGVLDATIGGNVSGNEYDGASAYAWNNAKTTVHIGGNVSSVEDNALYASGRHSGELKLKVDGNVSSDEYFGANVRATDSGKTDVVIGGDVTGTTGVRLYTNKDEEAVSPEAAIAELRISGNVIGTEEMGTYIKMGGENGSTLLEIGGDLKGKTSGLATSLVEDAQTSDVLVVGTISSDEGTPVQLRGGAETPDNLKLTVWQIVPKDDIIAESALLEEGSIVGYERNEAFEKSIKYIIKLEQPEVGGSLSATKADGSALDLSHDYETALEGEKVLLKVNMDPGYIVKGAYNGLGEKVELLMDSEGNYYVVVPKGGGVYLSVDLEKEKYNVSFVNEDGTELQKNQLEYGDMPNYTGETPTKAEDEHYTYSFTGWTPEIDKVTGEITYKATFSANPKTFSLSFDLGEGSLNGKTGTITIDAKYGDTINLPGAPTREGYTFLYWRGSRYDAGASYTIDGAHTFTAVWEKNPEEPAEDPEQDSEEPKQDPEEAPGQEPGQDSEQEPEQDSTPEKKDDSATSDTPAADKNASDANQSKTVDGNKATSKGAPETGDNNSIAFWTALLVLQMGLVAAMPLRKRISKDN